MLRALALLTLSLAAMPASAAPIPVFSDPKALLDAIYDQYLFFEEDFGIDDYDPDGGFDESEAYSRRLGALLDTANEKVYATGIEMGALDFSPFINGQDTDGLTYDVAEPRIKGNRAIAYVGIVASGQLLHTITFRLVDEGAERGWKIDDILLPQGDSGETFPLSDYLADPLAH